MSYYLHISHCLDSCSNFILAPKFVFTVKLLTIVFTFKPPNIPKKLPIGDIIFREGIFKKL